MRLILGGYANGRTVYAMQKYQLTAQDCFDASQQPLTDWQGQRLILHVESLTARWLTEGKTQERKFSPGWKNGKTLWSSARKWAADLCRSNRNNAGFVRQWDV